MKKYINILLLCCVLIVWGIILYRLVSPHLIPENQINYGSNIITPPFRNVARDTFKLETLRRDPFLNKAIYTPRQNSVVTSTKQKVAGKPPEVVWPQIVYYGFIKSGASKGELILIKINGKLLKFRIGTEADDIRIIQVYKDSVKLAYRKEQKIFYAN